MLLAQRFKVENSMKNKKSSIANEKSFTAPAPSQDVKPQQEISAREKVWELRWLAKHFGVTTTYLSTKIKKLGMKPIRHAYGCGGPMFVLRENEVIVLCQWRSPDRIGESFKLPLGYFWR